MSDTMPGKEIVIGGETVSAKDDYLKTLTNLFYKINAAADGKTLSELAWGMNFYTDVLISAILDPDARDLMTAAKEDILQSEIIKTRYATRRDTLTDEDTRQCQVKTCTIIAGELRNYFDKYFGFEIKMAVLV
jgi:hypothetical protein